MQQKTVFISYRRALSKHLARCVYMDLDANDWDVFLDVNTIDSGDFDRIILNHIGKRAHFILLISKGSLERCNNAGDWVLREIEEAVRLNRNIIPIVEEEVNFTEEIAYLPEKLRIVISKKNTLPLSHYYFDSAMDKLRTRFLKTPEYIEQIDKTPPEVQSRSQNQPTTLQARAYMMGIRMYAYFNLTAFPEKAFDRSLALREAKGHCAKLGLSLCSKIDKLSEQNYIDIAKEIQTELTVKKPSVVNYFYVGAKLPILLHTGVEGLDIRKEILEMMKLIRLPDELRNTQQYNIRWLDSISSYFWGLLID